MTANRSNLRDAIDIVSEVALRPNIESDEVSFSKKYRSRDLAVISIPTIFIDFGLQTQPISKPLVPLEFS